MRGVSLDPWQMTRHLKVDEGGDACFSEKKRSAVNRSSLPI